MLNFLVFTIIGNDEKKKKKKSKQTKHWEEKLINPFTFKILLVILPIVCHTILMMLIQRIWYWIN